MRGLRSRDLSGMSPKSRQYRHKSRQVPCDKCRQQKVKCRVDGQPPCHRCRHNPSGCIFTNENDLSRVTSPVTDHELSTRLDPASPEAALSQFTPSPHISNGPADILGSDDQWPFATTSIDHLLSTQTLSTQISQSLDQIEGHHYQLCGGSSDQDPWLLRHCKFDEFGFRKFFKIHIRNAGGVPTRDKIPAHFLVSEDGLNEAAKSATRIGGGDHSNLRAELMLLVPVHHGIRLLHLFMKRIFPLLPIISRTQLDLEHNKIPEAHVIERIPTHLLAAIYASTLPFAHEDDYLCLVTAYEKPANLRLWTLVYSLIQEEIHTPRLSVVQASLLYLHRKINGDDRNHSLTDTTFTWSFMGTLVGLTHSLGLHLQCSLFGLPAQEKRLRRRLWWAVYIEDKWMSMLFGRPPYIRSTEWDVVELGPDDFAVGSRPGTMTPNHIKLPFENMASLAVIVESVQENLYSLKMSQKLAEDVAGSIAIAKPLFRSLSNWREPQDSITESQSRYPATIYFAYLTLVACIWRAVLRATVRSSEPPQVIDIHDIAEDCSLSMEDFTTDINPYPEINFQPALNSQENGTLIQELYQASLNCATTIVEYSANLPLTAFSEFWYSWSRSNFSLISNFLILLLVQAPDYPKACIAKQIVKRWREILDSHRSSFPISSLAQVRLASYYSIGLEETFHLPPHVQQAIQESP